MINGLKEIENIISLWVKFKEKRIFPQLKKSCLFSSYFEPMRYLIGEKERFFAAKEIIDSPVILNQCGIGEKEFWYDYDVVIFLPTLLITIS